MTVRVVSGLALSLLSALMLALTGPATGDLWWLIFAAFVPMYIAQYRLLPRRWSAVAVSLAFAGHWLAVALLARSVVPAWAVALVVVVAAAVGLIVGLVLRPFAERTGYRWFVVQFGLVWVSLDLLIQDNEIIGSYMWLAYRLGDAPRLIQPVSITSTPALTLLLHVVNAAIALAVIAMLDRRRGTPADASAIPRRVPLWSVTAVAILAVVWLITSLILFTDVSHRMGPDVRVATVQPGLRNATPGTLIAAGDLVPGRSGQQRHTDQIAQLSDLTRAAAAQGAKIVVWPEETLDYDPRVENTAWIPALLRETGVYLAMGFTPNAEDGAAPNTGLLWNPQGVAEAVYLKNNRVVLEGEAFPRGTVFPTMATPWGAVGMIICFDIDFPNGPARRTAANGAQAILAPSIDFQSVSGARTASTVFRAVENRVAMVKADVAWDSIIVAPNGRVVAATDIRTELGDQALLVADIPFGPGGAPFTRYGGAPFQWACYLATLAMMAAMVMARRRTGRAMTTSG